MIDVELRDGSGQSPATGEPPATGQPAAAVQPAAAGQAAASGRIAVVRIDRPDRRNALDVDHCVGLRTGIGRAVDAGARVIVLTGVGTSFCAGADLDQVYGEAFTDALYGALHAITEAPVPVIAAVNGPAIGAGLQLALAADLRVAAEKAVFAIPTARLGLAVDPWTLGRLAELVGGGPARAVVLGCETMPVSRALELGFVQRAGGLDVALAWAAELAGLAPLTLAYSKRAFNEFAESAAKPSAAVTAAYEACWASEDAREGRLARAEKRAAVFQGR
ncbi:enoyl-CoA hydratase [Frankia sp. EI5c]|uniref:enoyl-CoA hydratase n=1 Tax=Frankia sp. EI5c TaxID=683316 RepID=UPI0007C3B3E0|nr:enoyl-CoA hydratase [Frankia sp. EI5c]OAA23866.1 enoyl-CoA hydratase [Frankia sp. EI5c]